MTHGGTNAIVFLGEATIPIQAMTIGIRHRKKDEQKLSNLLKEGKIQGYLAYCGGKIVGWCNATADCRLGVSVLLSWGWPIEECHEKPNIKSIFCFVITPEMQRKGIATMLAECVCKDEADDGFDFVEAYTYNEFTQDGFSGPLALYEKCGFKRCGEQEGKIVVRKALK